jgi:hypothetical protein
METEHQAFYWRMRIFWWNSNRKLSIRMERSTCRLKNLKWHSIQRGNGSFCTSEWVIDVYIFFSLLFCYSFSLVCNRLHMNFTNLFNGNAQLGENMNKFINENWREILDDLKATIVDSFASVFQTIINHVFNNFAYTDMFNNWNIQPLTFFCITSNLFIKHSFVLEIYWFLFFKICFPNNCSVSYQ